MLFTPSIAALVIAYTGFVSAAPASTAPAKATSTPYVGTPAKTNSNVKGHTTFRLPQVAKGRVAKKPAVGMLNTYAKYAKLGAVAPKSVVKAAAAQQKGTVVATPEAYDQSYLCPVTVGGQLMNLNFDTGSADLWVYSSLQPSTQQSGHAVYNPSNSATSSLKSGLTWNIQYGDGSSAGGNVYADKVVIGAVTATSQAVEAATSVSSSFLDDTEMDGLVGLSFSSINTVRPTQQTTFFDTVKSTLEQKLFTATLKKGAPGSYDFGYIDPNKFTGPITYVNVNTRNGFWQFNSGGYQVGSAKAVYTNIDSIADTGTTLMYMPDAVVNAYYAKVSGATNNASVGGWIFPCSATMPDFYLIVGGAKRRVPGSYMNYAPVGQNLCFGGMQSNTGIGFTILGDVFLKSQFVVFSQVTSTPQIGFAAQKGV